jgi:hypothetical protein
MQSRVRTQEIRVFTIMDLGSIITQIIVESYRVQGHKIRKYLDNCQWVRRVQRDLFDELGIWLDEPGPFPLQNRISIDFQAKSPTLSRATEISNK